MENKTIDELVARFDEVTEPINEWKISDAISQEGYRYDDSNELSVNAEILAFNFVENITEQDVSSKYYYGPIYSIRTDSGVNSFPRHEQVSIDIFEYWIKRATEAKHPLLKARYSDLVCDFSKTITGKNADIKHYQNVIDNTIHIARNNLHTAEVIVFVKFKRAFNLALTINDANRIKTLAQELVEYETKVAEDDSPGLWGHSYELLIENNKVRKHILEEQEYQIIKDLEEALYRVSDLSAQKTHINATDRAATKLAKYYKNVGKYEDVRRVLLKLGDVYKSVNKDARPLQISARLNILYDKYKQFGLEHEATEVLRDINDIGPKIKEGLSEISHEFQISDLEMRNWVSSIVEHNFDNTVARLIHEFIPSQEFVRKTIAEKVKQYPLQYHVTGKVLDSRGRYLATISPISKSLDDHICNEMSKMIYYLSVFLRPCIHAFKTKFMINEKNLLAYMLKSPIFNASCGSILMKGLIALFADEHIAASHILVPQIESAFRKLIEIEGGDILKPTRGGGFNYISLDNILSDPISENIYGNDITSYLRVLYTDNRGLNIRNNLAHGLMNDDSINYVISDRIFHTLLLLSIIRYN